MLLDRIAVVPRERYSAFEAAAKRITLTARAWNDWPYVALALAESAPVWSYDHDFLRMKGVTVLTTSAVEE